ncbi:lysophospholipid acyltransferase family protein [Helicobacter turcicus]|uniref:1-acyl-sn-glycerol-3-phosphate acyltransferase n=1 Tax=Helicobacter turcicus TaxID=2867412 RepID=A0ABS7JLD7_9HELI|nr:lysophospholipid acyltransferase family protein [Helicobacter turcicus]MBX7490191.1 1-acyl-sn-glycerol-3-phosphate acyltransferase [Helicobacter turcicus]MBX7545230.1 1-acyl-sn-glycerol-3-phosphate acyltransferase [Helicobacter turcicus]
MISKIRAYSALLYILFVIPFGIVLMYAFNVFHRKIRKSIAAVFFCLFRVRVSAEGKLDPTAQILIMNHQSFMDVMYFEAVHPNNLCWIAKKELGKVFLYGHALKAPKMILINRESKRELVFLLKEAKDRLESGRILCIFPEGTRSKGTEKLLPFKSGAKFLVEHFKLKVQPVVFCGTRKSFNFEKLEFENSPFSVQYLESFIPENPNWFEELQTHMQEVYTSMYQRQNQCMEE